MIHAEFLIEPFVEGKPGAHVLAALDACRDLGLEPEVGAFATTISGPSDLVHEAVTALTKAAMACGATAVQVRLGESTAHTSRFGELHDALERLVEGVEAELGGQLSELSRADKQAAVRMLDERGAFLLRKAVEAVGEMMGVSRITIYNYLNALDV